MDDASIGICRAPAGMGWLLLRKETNAKWAMIGGATTPLSAVIGEALKLLAGGDFSFSDRRLDEQFTWPKSPEPAELGKIRNTTTTIFAPEHGGDDPIWGSLTRDLNSELIRGAQRWRTPSLIQEIVDWFRYPNRGGGYQSFEKPNSYSFARDLIVRRSWRLHDIAPLLFPDYDQTQAEHARNRRHG